MLVARPATTPTATASRTEGRRAIARRMETKAIHPRGHRAKSRKLAATANPPSSASASRSNECSARTRSTKPKAPPRGLAEEIFIAAAARRSGCHRHLVVANAHHRALRRVR
jgi:hypothetical protein